MAIKYFILLLYIIMDSFQIIVLVVAIILLIVIFTSMGVITKYYSTENTLYPSMANTCPDTWAVTSTNTCTVPQSGALNSGSLYSGDILNIDSIGTRGYVSGTGEINFSDNTIWAGDGKSALCNKKLWANKYGIAWDGVTNANICV